MVRRALLLASVFLCVLEATALAATLHGKTAQNLPVSAGVTNGKLTDLSIDVSGKCSDGRIYRTQFRFHQAFKHPQKANGQVGDASTGIRIPRRHGTADGRFSARVKRNGVSGSFVGTFRFPKGLVCRTGNVGFRAP